MFCLIESEEDVKKNFISLLNHNGYETVKISNENDIIDNFKNQLEVFNETEINNIDKILDYLYDGDLFSKFDRLRNGMGDIKFIDFSDFSSNIFQVSEEVTFEGKYTNRYDVIIFINGFPIVEIELKKSGVNLKQAFNQINRYSDQSYSRLLDFIQIFVISNKVHTRYFFNDSNFDYDSSYEWQDNKTLESFTNSFLLKENLMNILSKYIFRDLISNDYKMLRPYQINSIEKSLNQVKNRQNAYIWMNYGTGKTITSLRFAQLLSKDNNVVYIVSNDLSMYPSRWVCENKHDFIKKVSSKNFIITNIRSILSLKEEMLEDIKNNEYIFIFNEYEKYYDKYNPLNLMELFKNSLFYCFTSSPIFDDNIVMDKTTKFIFNNRVYQYSFKNALSDKTNLGFEVEYIGDDEFKNDYSYSSDIRISQISDFIAQINCKKTFNQQFKSILITSSNADLLNYYFNLKPTDLKIAPLLRFDTNDIYNGEPVRNYLNVCIDDYNQLFGSEIEYDKNVSGNKTYASLESDIIKRFNNGEIDLLLIDESVLKNIYSTNILSNLKNPKINTVYLDCNLDNELLFEALSMSNEKCCREKISGNIVLFRDLRKNISKSIKIYSGEDIHEDYTLKNYEDYLNIYNELLNDIKDNQLIIKKFKKLENIYSILSTFPQFDFKQSQQDEFNTIKDSYEHEIMDIESQKHIIYDFKLDYVDKYKIDLDYIDNLFTDNSTIISDTLHSSLSAETQQPVNSNKPLYEYHMAEIIFDDGIDDEMGYVKECPNCGEKYPAEYNFCPNCIKQELIESENFIKACPNCGRKYENKDYKYCMYCDGKFELVDIDDLVKVCPKCGRRYSENSQHCFNSEHGPNVKLVHINDLSKQCSICGSKYSKEYDYCLRCDSSKLLDEIKHVKIEDIDFAPNKYYNFIKYPNIFTTSQELLSDENIYKLNQFDLSESDFNEIIENIKQTFHKILHELIKHYSIDLNSLTPLEKILLMSKSFVKINYKTGGPQFGYYEFNQIFIDFRQEDALQITTIIHELSHFLVSEILEQVVSKLLNAQKTDVLEGYITYIFSDIFCDLVDEYCAHTVDGSYSRLGYQDYSSYKEICSKFLEEYGEECIIVVNEIGNTFAKYIKDILNSYIHMDLKRDIKKEFDKINRPPNYNELQYETSKVLNWDKFVKALKLILLIDYDDIFKNSDNFNKLEIYTNKFRENNL